jgi:hypothetical protein
MLEVIIVRRIRRAIRRRVCCAISARARDM